MVILYVLLGCILYSFIVVVLGIIKWDETRKKKIFMIMSAIYNGFMGYIDTFVILLLYGYFSNQPKGSGYEVPASEAGFNRMLGVISLILYLILLIPINIYMKKKGKISQKFYLIINFISTVLGIALFWIFFDQEKSLF